MRSIKKWIFLAPFIFIGISLLKKKQRVEINTGLASIKSMNVIVWARPKKLETVWQLHHKNWPVFILEVTKHWVKIVDAYNTVGWIEKKYLGLPYVLILEDTLALEKKFADKIGIITWPTIEEIQNKKLEKHALLLKQNVAMKLSKIQNNKDFCTIEITTNFETKQYYVPTEKIWIGPNKANNLN